MASDERLLLRAAATDPYVPWGACDKASEARMPAILMDCPVVSSRAAGPGSAERGGVHRYTITGGGRGHVARKGVVEEEGEGGRNVSG